MGLGSNSDGMRDPFAYARRALDDECALLASTGHGRNDQVNRSGFALGQFIPGGYLSQHEVEHRIMTAAEASGIVRKDGVPAVRASMRSGIQSGMRQPRDLGQGEAPSATVHVLRPKPELSGVNLPTWTEPDAETGKPKFGSIGRSEPFRFDDEARRHLYVRDGEVVRVKVKKTGGGFSDWYRVRRPSDGAVGWQARKPEGFVPCPYVPPDARNPFDPERCGEALIWSEGEKDADAFHAAGFLAFTFGSASDVPDVSDLLHDHAIIIAVDNDEAGRKSIARKVSAAAQAGARSIRLVQFPDLPEGGDAADFFAAGGDAEGCLDRAETIDPAAWRADADIPPPQDGAEGDGFRDWDADRSSSHASPPAYTITAQPFVWQDPTTFPRRQWLYGRHLVRKFVSCTVAPGGMGKSSLALVEAVAMATGRPLLGVKVDKPLVVWVINLEDPLEEIQRRVLAVLLHFRIHPDELGGRLFLNSGRDTKVIIASTTKAGTMVAQPVVEAFKQEIRVKAVDVVQIDPMVKAHAVPENDNPAVDMVCTALAEIADECDCAFDLIHHVRKTNGAEVTVEDSRGASALLSACRSARALNRMTKEEAEKAGVMDARLFFRAETGKANLAPPEKAEWFQLRNVPLGNGEPDLPFDNGDQVAVATSWTWPDALESVTVSDLQAVQRAVADGKWRADVQASEWVGKAVAAVLRLDPDSKADRARISEMLKIWLGSGALRRVAGKDKKGNERAFVEVGTWATK